MLSTTLVTNEVKNAAGAEVEFERTGGEGRSSVYSARPINYALPNCLNVKHSESGSGITRRRRSVVRFDKTVISTVDLVTPVTVSVYAVADIPEGALLANTEAANVLAQLNSFLSTTGAATAVLFDGTGNGSQVLLNGTL